MEEVKGDPLEDEKEEGHEPEPVWGKVHLKFRDMVIEGTVDIDNVVTVDTADKRFDIPTENVLYIEYKR